MAQSDHRRGQESIVVGRKDAPRAVILFHGYTGSPAEFGDLPHLIAERLDAEVIIPLLPGHGTKVEDLLPLEFRDFFRVAEKHVDEVVRSGRPFALGGHSFGGHLAFLMGSATQPFAVFSSAVPYKPRFWMKLPFTRILARLRPLWEKQLTPEELAARKGHFYYSHMPGKALRLIRQGNKRLRKTLPNIECPAFTVHARYDRLAYADSGEALLARTRSEIRQSVVIESSRHGMFYGHGHEHIVQSIVQFLERALFEYNGRQK